MLLGPIYLLHLSQPIPLSTDFGSIQQCWGNIMGKGCKLSWAWGQGNDWISRESHWWLKNPGRGRKVDPRGTEECWERNPGKRRLLGNSSKLIAVNFSWNLNRSLRIFTMYWAIIWLKEFCSVPSKSFKTLPGLGVRAWNYSNLITTWGCSNMRAKHIFLILNLIFKIKIPIRTFLLLLLMSENFI